MATGLGKIKEKRGKVKILAQMLRQEITGNRLPADTPISSVRALAAKYKVSLLTANRALNMLVEDNIIYRVQGSGTFVAEHKKWLSGKPARVGLCFYGSPARYLSESYYNTFGIHNGRIVDMLKHNGHDVSVISRTENELLDIFQNTINHTDALILNKDFITDRNIEMLLVYPNPIILMDSQFIKDLPFHQVVPDYFVGFKKVIEHLKELNCKSVACAGVSDTETHRFRRNYFVQMLDKFNKDIVVHEDLTIPLKDHDMGRMTGRELAKMYLSRAVRPDVIFSVSDFISFGILDVLLANNLVPGRDFKLISVGNIEAHNECPFGKPMLTSLTRSRQQETEEIIKLLEEVMISDDKAVRIIKVPAGKLVIRKTT